MIDRLRVWAAGANRVYPSCCTSAYCGRTDCSGCRNEPEKAAWDEWVRRARAVREDPVWCPSVWTATVGSRP